MIINVNKLKTGGAFGASSLVCCFVWQWVAIIAICQLSQCMAAKVMPISIEQIHAYTAIHAMQQVQGRVANTRSIFPSGPRTTHQLRWEGFEPNP